MVIELLVLGSAAAAGRALWRRLSRPRIEAHPAMQAPAPEPAPAPGPPPWVDADLITGATALALAGAGAALRSTPLGIASAPLTLWSSRAQIREAARTGLVDRRLSYAVLEAGVTFVAIGTGAFAIAAGNAALHITATKLARRTRHRTPPAPAPAPTAWVDLGELSSRDAGSIIALECPASAIPPGARVHAGAGETLAVDGVVVTGHARLDTRALDGRLTPRDVAAGDRVTAGARLVGGRIALRAAAPAPPAAPPERDPSERIEDIADRATRVADAGVGFTLATGALAAITFGPGAALGALGGNLVGTWRTVGPFGLERHRQSLARAGIRLADGRAFELLAGIDRFAVDLGALIEPDRLTLAAAFAAPGHDAGDALAWAAAALFASDDPTAAALIEALALRGRALPTADARQAHGDGAFTATCDGHPITVAPPRVLHARGVAPDPALATHRAAAAGQIVLALAVDGVEAALLCFDPTLRPGATSLFTGLRALGVLPLLTGADPPATTARLLDALDAGDPLFEVSPTDRAALIDALRATGHLVACLGASAADLLAMAAADVALCVSPADAAARSLADIHLDGVPLDHIPALIALARRYHRAQGKVIALFTLATGVMGLGAIGFGLGAASAIAVQAGGIGAGVALLEPTPFAASLPSCS